MHTGVSPASLYAIAALTRAVSCRHMTGSWTFSQEASFLGSAFPMRPKCVFTLANQITSTVLLICPTALPHHLQGLFRRIQPMVSPSREYLFCIWYAQHVRSLPFPRCHSKAVLNHMPRVVKQQAVVRCCRYYVSGPHSYLAVTTTYCVR